MAPEADYEVAFQDLEKVRFFWSVYSATMERCDHHFMVPFGKLTTFFNGKTHYKWQFSIALLNYQRVCSSLSLIYYVHDS